MFREQFEKLHPPERCVEFARASGVLQLLLYKAEIEGMLRTSDLAGFDLNGLIDYPGEGVALIAVLDVFLDSKGIATPEEFRPRERRRYSHSLPFLAVLPLARSTIPTPASGLCHRTCGAKFLLQDRAPDFR